MLTKWGGYKYKQIDQRNRTESTEIDPQIYAELIFEKLQEHFIGQKDIIFN